jgi:hypothetical protein
MSKKSNKKYNNDNKIRDNNIINDFTKKNIFKYIISDYSILNYKLIFYWLPPLLFTLVLIGFIFITHSESEYFITLIAGLIIYIIYFLVDVIYQFILCKKTSKFKLIKNSIKNAFIPCIFVSLGYFLAIVLRDVKKCNIQYHNTSEEHSGSLHKINTDITRIINIHRNNIIVSLFFYLFSIIYSNPINKKKCVNNDLC